MVVGVLAFQGDFAEHIDVLHAMHVPSVEVRSVADLSKVNALIIPGGESTVIAKFLASTKVGSEIIKRTKAGTLFLYGTCAGAILLSKKATGKNAPRTLGLMDVTVDRNAYGSQVDSFETTLRIHGIKAPIHVSFIRAPKITRIGKYVEVLAEFDGEPVLVRQGNVMIGTFHPEVRHETALHELFLTSMRSH